MLKIRILKFYTLCFSRMLLLSGQRIGTVFQGPGFESRWRCMFSHSSTGILVSVCRDELFRSSIIIAVLAVCLLYLCLSFDTLVGSSDAEHDRKLKLVCIL